MDFQEFMKDVDAMLENNGLMIKNGELLGYYGDDDSEIIIPEGVTSIVQDCFKKKRIREIVLPSTINDIAIQAFNKCTIGKLVLGTNKVSENAFDRCYIRNLILLGTYDDYDLNFDGCQILSLKVQEGVKNVKLKASSTANAIMPSSILTINNDSFTRNEFPSVFSLTISERTWLSDEALADVNVLNIWYKNYRGIKALNHIIHTLSNHNCKDVREVCIIDGELSLFEAIKLKRMFPELKFTFRTMEIKELEVAKEESSSISRI